jgi:eukaryotic-like serine/threonine-protein kinase
MIGTQLGNFRLVALLGAGGMGEVYVAEHVSVATRVAIKVLRAEISQDAEAIRRLFREAELVGRIRHAGIAKIFDVGFHAGRAYLAMELLDGESLARRIVLRGPVPVPQLIDLARQIASTLEAAHRAGVIHRDLKPENIYLVSDDDHEGRERVKVLDFGVAKLSGAPAGSLVPRTIGLMGTPTYMSPEQWGDGSQVTWASDAYALGCVLYEMACTQPPFDAGSMAEACTMHLHDTPRSLGELAPDAPAALVELVARLLSKQPAARGASMAAIASELAAIELGGAAPRMTTSYGQGAPAASAPATSPPSASAPRPASGSSASTTLSGSSGELGLAARAPRPRWLRGGALGGLGVVGLALVGLVARGGSDPPPAGRARSGSPTAMARTPAPDPAPAMVAEAALAMAPDPAPATAPGAVAAAAEPVVAAPAPNEPAPPAAAPVRAGASSPAAARPGSPSAPARPPSAPEVVGRRPGRGNAVPPDRAAGRSAMGVLNLSSDSPCDIHLDGQDTGLRTPQRALTLPPGVHHIRLVNGSLGIADELVVQIFAGKTTRRHRRRADRTAAPAAQGSASDRQTINPFQRKDAP